MIAESAVVRPHRVEAATAALYLIDRSGPTAIEMRRRRRPRGRTERSARRVRAPPAAPLRRGQGGNAGIALT
jgi:hypothetical protein